MRSEPHGARHAGALQPGPGRFARGQGATLGSDGLPGTARRHGEEIHSVPEGLRAPASCQGTQALVCEAGIQAGGGPAGETRQAPTQEGWSSSKPASSLRVPTLAVPAPGEGRTTRGLSGETGAQRSAGPPAGRSRRSPGLKVTRGAGRRPPRGPVLGGLPGCPLTFSPKEETALGTAKPSAEQQRALLMGSSLAAAPAVPPCGLCRIRPLTGL